MNGITYFAAVDHIFQMQLDIENLLARNLFTNQREFLLKLQQKVNELEKFAVANWIEYRKDEDDRENASE